MDAAGARMKAQEQGRGQLPALAVQHPYFMQRIDQAAARHGERVAPPRLEAVGLELKQGGQVGDAAAAEWHIWTVKQIGGGMQPKYWDNSRREKGPARALQAPHVRGIGRTSFFISACRKRCTTRRSRA